MIARGSFLLIAGLTGLACPSAFALGKKAPQPQEKAPLIVQAAEWREAIALIRSARWKGHGAGVGRKDVSSAVVVGGPYKLRSGGKTWYALVARTGQPPATPECWWLTLEAPKEGTPAMDLTLKGDEITCKQAEVIAQSALLTDPEPGYRDANLDELKLLHRFDSRTWREAWGNARDVEIVKTSELPTEKATLTFESRALLLFNTTLDSFAMNTLVGRHGTVTVINSGGERKIRPIRVRTLSDGRLRFLLWPEWMRSEAESRLTLGVMNPKIFSAQPREFMTLREDGSCDLGIDLLPCGSTKEMPQVVSFDFRWLAVELSPQTENSPIVLDFQQVQDTTAFLGQPLPAIFSPSLRVELGSPLTPAPVAP